MIWIPVGERWEVSDSGAVRNRINGHVLTPRMTEKGYLVVSLGRKSPSVRVHRIVLIAFSGPCPDGKESNHRNGVRTDNRAENLEWITHEANIRDAYSRGSFKARDEKRALQPLCKNGHPRTPYSRCEPCRTVSNRRHQSRRYQVRKKARE